jgi:hypothetical protein
MTVKGEHATQGAVTVDDSIKKLKMDVVGMACGSECRPKSVRF